MVFDLEGIDSGRTYLLITKPYNAGNVYSDDITASGKYDFRVGKVPVTLRDLDNGAPILNQKITARRKLPDGRLEWVASGISDSNGTVHFDPQGIGGDPAYIFHTRNPFGNSKSFYSDIVMQEGPMNFGISRTGDYSLDLTPPFLTIDAPATDALVSDVGFEVSGQASDNQVLKKVTVSIVDPVLGITTMDLDTTTGYWRFPVTGAMVSTGKTVTLTAHAYDRMQNVTTATIQVAVIHDVKAPILDILSHSSGDEVADVGFLVSGNASDNTGIANLTCRVEDSLLGPIDINRPVEISPNSGRWTFVVNNLSAEGTARVSINAIDMAGNSTTRTVNLVVIHAAKDIRHLINRITFGATPSFMKEARVLGVDGLITQQLHPESIDNSEFETTLTELGEPDNRRELQHYQLVHALNSKRQLLEVMTFFWDNHFNTDISKTGIDYELKENRLFRQNALGRFRDLLQISATSPAMLRYLDNHSSHKRDPNENYARELMELHTLGVNGGYTATDVSEVARVFTGWGIRDREFFFNQYRHDDDEKEVLSQIIPAGSRMDGGEQVLDILASHPSTAKYICTKLLRLFISDSPTDTIINECASVFLNAYDDVDQIAQVIRTILYSESFGDTQNFHGKAKTPLEFTSSFVRNVGANSSSYDMRVALGNMGMPLFMNPIPTGWSEIGPTWLNSNQLLQRMLFINRIVFNRPRDRTTHLDNPSSSLFVAHGYETMEGVIGYLFYLALALDYSSLEWDEAVSILTENGNSPFDIFANSANDRLRALIGFVFSLPNSQLQ